MNTEAIKIINDLNRQIQNDLNDYDTDFHFLILIFILSFKWDKDDKYNYETFYKVFNIIKNNEQLRELFASFKDI